MKAPEVSIIVPVYNAEAYLSRCVHSILRQTHRNWELLLVDDGSTDGSSALCDSYAAQDARIRVLHQQNGGVSAARNAGLKAAEGTYVGFVDADDWIEPEMYACLLREAARTGADVVMCDATTVYENGAVQADTITQLPESGVLEKSDFTPALLLEMAGSACRCIYRNDRRCSRPRPCPLAFPPGVKFSEDRIFNLYAFGQAGCVAYRKQAFYNRYMNRKSAVHRFHADYFEAYKLAAQEIEQAIRLVWDDDARYQRAYLGQLIGGALGAVCNYFYRTSTLRGAARRQAVKAVCADRQLQTALQQRGAWNRKERWLRDRGVCLLILYARAANWKHGR